jgi:hypothetical protein
MESSLLRPSHGPIDVVSAKCYLSPRPSDLAIFIKSRRRDSLVSVTTVTESPPEEKTPPPAAGHNGVY